MTKLKLSGGTDYPHAAQGTGVVQIIGDGRTTYLWIGREAVPQFCYGTTTGTRELRALAHEILKRVGTRAKRRKR